MIVQYESSLRAVGYCTVPRERVRVESTAHGSRVHTSQTHQIVSAQWAPRVGPDVQCARAPTRLWRTTKRNSRPKRKGQGFQIGVRPTGQGGRVSVHTAPTRHTPSLHAAVLSGRLWTVRPAGPAGSPGQRQRQHAHTTAWLFSDTLGRRGDITLSTGFPFRFTARRPFRFV